MTGRGREKASGVTHIVQAGNDLFIGKDEAYIMNRKNKEKSMLRIGRERVRA